MANAENNRTCQKHLEVHSLKEATTLKYHLLSGRKIKYFFPKDWHQNECNQLIHRVGINHTILPSKLDFSNGSTNVQTSH